MHKLAFYTFVALLLLLPGRAYPQDKEKPKSATSTADQIKAAPEIDVGKLLERLKALESQLRQIQQAREDEELEKLRQSASTEAASAPDKTVISKDRTYITASRSLQALNPEISVSGDFLAQLVLNEDFTGYAGANDRSGLPLRALDLHVQSTLDPFSFTKIALGFMPYEGVSLEELYITWTGVIPRCTLTVGHFRQQFGVVNRWHEHDLDQTGYPLALDELLGEGGLSQSGLSLSWLMPALWAHTNELTIQVTDGLNEHLFAGEYFSVPTVLVHLKNYYDLSENTYLELGLTGMFGFNNQRGYPDPDIDDLLLDDDYRTTYVAGADLTLFWSPLKQARYRSLTWRSEGLWVRKETETDTRHGWGIYSYLQYQLGASWFVGLRADLVEPLNNGNKTLLWQAVPYVTFWQSEFVYLRLEVRHGEVFEGGHDTRVLFQVNWAAGPHKHEKY
ncbi:MAG: hypothetical protein JRJ87_08570 [Deltaproteobacteria bacterium]|nr:hypothetical protein [Deltaproteobacteria bacterium]